MPTQMMKILIWPNPLLKQVSESVTEPPDPNFISEMFATMNRAGGVGLSAIQVGVPKKIVVAKIGAVNKVIINGNWTFAPNGLTPLPMLEGCLSTPGQYEMVDRYPEVIVTYHDANLQSVTETMTGLWAHMIQHELEHAAGGMYTDHLTSANRSRILGEMIKLKRSKGSKY